MFSFRFGSVMNVHTASAFKNQNGDPGFVIIMMENENQPEGIERPSRSKNQIKIWGTGEMPAELHNGCKITIDNAAGFDWKSLPRKNKQTGEPVFDRYGNPVFDQHIELIAPTIHVINTVEKAKKNSKKAEG